VVSRLKRGHHSAVKARSVSKGHPYKARITAWNPRDVRMPTLRGFPHFRPWLTLQATGA